MAALKRYFDLETGAIAHAEHLLAEKKCKISLRSLWDSFKCRHCSQRAGIYRRSLNKQMARSMLAIKAKFVNSGLRWTVDWCRIDSTLQGFGVDPQGGDKTKPSYWGLMESKGSDGLWRLTQTGRDFLAGDCEASQFAIVFDDTVLCYGGAWVGIDQALGTENTWFDTGDMVGLRMQPVRYPD